MKKIPSSFLCAAVFVFMLNIIPTPAFAFDVEPLLVPDKTGSGYAADRLIVRLKDDKDTTSLNSTLKKFQGSARRRIGQTRSFIIDVKPNRRESLRKTLLKNKRVEKILVDHAYPATGGPDDPYYVSQWHLDAIHAPDAWGYTTGESSFKVAILDSGIDESHPDLANKVITGWNVQNQNTDTTDPNGHGTQVAGVVAATLNNTEGGTGVAPDVALVPIKITINDSKYTFSSAIAEGIAYAQSVGALVANISYHIFAGDDVINETAASFVKAGGLIFVSSGNDGKHYDFKDNKYLINVSATDQSGQFATFSSHGPFVDLSAPGVNIITTTLNNSYASVQGTSFASPIAAATAALMWSANPSLSNASVEAALKQTANDLGNPGRDDATGFGLIDTGAAVAAVALEKPKTEIAPLLFTPILPITSTAPITIAPIITSAPSGRYLLQLQITSGKIKVNHVDYFDGDTRVASLTDAPYTLQWTPDGTNAFNFKAQAYTDDGLYTMQISIRIQKEKVEPVTAPAPAQSRSVPVTTTPERTPAPEQTPASTAPVIERQTIRRAPELIREAPPATSPEPVRRR